MITMRFALVGSTLVTVQAGESPTDAECRRWLAFVRDPETRASLTGVLAYTLGGAPSARQRHAVSTWRQSMAPHIVPIAVVTNSILVRAAVRTLTWAVNDHLRPFTPTELREALVFLRIPAAQKRTVRGRVRSLFAELGIRVELAS